MKLPSVKLLAPPKHEEEGLTKMQKRRRNKKCERDAAIKLLQAQLAATTPTSASALAVSNNINENFSVESAVLSASDNAPASTRKPSSKPIIKPLIIMPSDTSVWITVGSKTKRPQFKRRMSEN